MSELLKSSNEPRKFNRSFVTWMRRFEKFEDCVRTKTSVTTPPMKVESSTTEKSALIAGRRCDDDGE